MSDRALQLAQFVAQALARRGRSATGPWQSITGDASFRHFHRVPTDFGSLIAVDAPPTTENNGQYLRIAQHWRGAGLPVPQVLADDLQQGFFLVSDLGSLLFAEALSRHTAQAASPDAEPLHGTAKHASTVHATAEHATAEDDQLYRRAIELLWRIQALPDDGTCPPYELARLQMELGIFREWFLQAALGYAMTPAESALLAHAETVLLANIAEQPRCCVHRDWHSRNLLVLPDRSLGIIDFQDALTGPYVYDLGSLLRDCDLRWPDTDVDAWQQHYLQGADSRFQNRAAFRTDFDLTGMQRHLKAIGIFARLWRRDGRMGYLPDIPRVLHYLRDVGTRHPPLHSFADWIATRIEPAWQRRASQH